MPTGYTCGVQDGTVKSFTEYATECMRAFGALVMLRDEKMGVPIPELEPTGWHRKGLIKAKGELSVIQSLSDSEIMSAIESEYERNMVEWDKETVRQEQIKSRYEGMLKLSRRFKPPTKDHTGFAEFLVSQLQESIKHDCYDRSEHKPKLKTVAEWKADKVSSLEWDIAYHEKGDAEEIARTNESNQWVKDARRAIAEVETCSISG